MRSRYAPTADAADTVTPAYVVNCPSPAVPDTRTVETKHATGQSIVGTVFSENAPAPHPVTVPCPHWTGSTRFAIEP